MSDKLKDACKAAQDFISQNLAACCQEELEWSETGILCDGKLREAAKMFSVLDKTHSLPIAQAETSRQAMRVVAERRAAPAQGDGKPVAWCVTYNGEFTNNMFLNECAAISNKKRLDEKYGGAREVKPLYTAPPAQQAVDLNDEQIRDAINRDFHYGEVYGADAGAMYYAPIEDIVECIRALLAAQKGESQ